MNSRTILLLSIAYFFIQACSIAENTDVIISRYDEQILSENNNNYQGVFIGGSMNGTTSEVSILKNFVYKGDNLVDVNLGMKMPSKPAKLEIVLAMDTSGSMVQSYYRNESYNDTHIKWICESIDEILYPDTRISIVSWDDENEENDLNTSFMSVKENYTEIKKILNNLSNECLETDHTVYSIGIKRAIKRLEAKAPEDPYNTSRIIIFVTGLSEFREEPDNVNENETLDSLLSWASKNRSYDQFPNSSFYGYQIFPIQIGIDSRFKWESDNLTKIASKTRISKKLPDNRPISISSIDNLSDAIASILENIRTRPIASNVEIIDSLYPYLHLQSSESQILSNNGSIRKIPSESLSDYYPTLIWRIGTMNGDDNWTAVLHTQIDINLPIDVTEKMTPVKFNAQQKEYNSMINYTWMTGYNCSIQIPEGRFSISTRPSGLVESKKDENIKEWPPSAKKQTGFEAILAFIGVATAKYFHRKR